MKETWYSKAWRRNVVDMHIDDWNEGFLAEFDAKQYVHLLETAGVESAVVYAHSHVGHCYYPTQLGHMHAGIQGRDIFKEVVDLCHEKGIAVVAYYSLIFNNWQYKQNPDWRIIRCDGTEAGQNSRYGVCCPNSPYRDQAVKETEELCNKYEFEGIRFDMTFWPTVCYCRYCQKRFADEVGGELPRKVDWRDTKWVAFQRKREQWLVEFAKLTTDAARRCKPGVSVEHQSSTFPLTWQFGVTTPLSKQNDFLQGDFYGGALQQSLVCKLLRNLTPNAPAGYETSLTGHIVGNNYKPEELLRLQTYGAVANSAAFIFIDSIHPSGRLNPDIYQTMRRIFSETRRCDAFLGGELLTDVAVYLSTESKYRLTKETQSDGAVSMNSTNEDLPHTENAVGAAGALRNHNIPFDVITRENLDSLDKYQVVILPNVIAMDEEEGQAFREFVKSGGGLYASKTTSLFGCDGRQREDFLLHDVLGVHFEGETEEAVTFIAPTEKGKRVAKGYGPNYPMSMDGSQVQVKAESDAEVLGQMQLPYTNPADKSKFASIHTNPPGLKTESPAIVAHSYGKGRAVYVAGELERESSHENVFVQLVRSLLGKPCVFVSDAPKSVEITVFDQPKKKRFVVHLLNFQAELPNLPIAELNVRMATQGRKVKGVVEAVSQNPLQVDIESDFVDFKVCDLQDYAMYIVSYQ